VSSAYDRDTEPVIDRFIAREWLPMLQAKLMRASTRWAKSEFMHATGAESFAAGFVLVRNQFQFAGILAELLSALLRGQGCPRTARKMRALPIGRIHLTTTVTSNRSSVDASPANSCQCLSLSWFEPGPAARNRSTRRPGALMARPPSNSSLISSNRPFASIPHR
jgi:hypothetical protein